ncbi:winged helix-turn-helix domain-containing protein [bacterium]|nr:winged helix-turn-helix domain-containing protein [bacterium]
MNSEGQENLKSHEAQVLSYLTDKPKAISQRDIAGDTGLSVGLVNAILKKLVNVGYVKVAHLNKRQVQYFLTTQGFSQKLKQSYRYIVNTVEHYKKLEKELARIIVNLYSEGYEIFSIHGDGAMRELIEVAFEGKLQPLPIILRKEHRFVSNSAILVLNGEEIECGAAKCVDVLKELGQLS